MKNVHAVALGRLGGLKGGMSRARSLSPRRRAEIARRAVKIRWSRHEAREQIKDLPKELREQVMERFERNLLAQKIASEHDLVVEDVERSLFYLTLKPLECLARSRRRGHLKPVVQSVRT